MAAKVLNESLYFHRIQGQRIKAQVRSALLLAFFTYLENRSKGNLTLQEVYRILFHLTRIIEDEGPALLISGSERPLKSKVEG